MIRAHWIARYANGNNVTYFYSFGDDYIPREITKLISSKITPTNIYRIQVNDSVMCGIIFY